jgi:hypothetical protein
MAQLAQSAKLTLQDQNPFMAMTFQEHLQPDPGGQRCEGCLSYSMTANPGKTLSYTGTCFPCVILSLI